MVDVDRKIKIYVDTADLEAIRVVDKMAHLAGVTTNPAHARKAGVKLYRAFGSMALQYCRTKPVSIEVLADDFDTMEAQARDIASWGKNAVVKIPVTDTSGNSAAPLIQKLACASVKVNVTAVFTEAQVVEVGEALAPGGDMRIVSIFAGRIADAGVDPLTYVRKCRDRLRKIDPNILMLWASPRQVYDVVLAEKAGCDIITMTPELISKLPLLGTDLTEFSRQTVKMFFDDGRGFAL